MSDNISREEFALLANDVKHVKLTVSETGADTKELVKSHQKFIKSQIKHNTETNCHKEQCNDFNKTIKKAALVFLALFSTSAGVGFYTIVPDKPDKEQQDKKDEVKEVFANNKNR